MEQAKGEVVQLHAKGTPVQGVWERDERRYNDSFETFEEVFKLAQEAKVDMVLLGGDLFHDNKPSRSTLVKCLDILNRYCLNDNPINFEVRLQSSADVAVRPAHASLGLPAGSHRAGQHATPCEPMPTWAQTISCAVCSHARLTAGVFCLLQVVSTQRTAQHTD